MFRWRSVKPVENVFVHKVQPETKEKNSQNFTEKLQQYPLINKKNSGFEANIVYQEATNDMSASQKG